MSKARSIDEMLPTATNFTVTQAERVRALEGLSAYLRRLGRIEHYYPIEANLPIDRATGLPRDGDGPFVARPFVSLAELLR